MTGGNMYEWISHTWNPLAGECPHQCEYCYVRSLVKRYSTIREKYTGPIRLDEKALKKRLPPNRTIFVCSMNDLFAEGVPDEYIKVILNKVLEERKLHREHENNQVFLFQTKNPRRLIDWIGYFPDGSIFATTIESNRAIVKTNAPPPEKRIKDYIEFERKMKEESKVATYEITIEPILDFDVDVLVKWIRDVKPNFVSIGADSKGHHLPEPDEEKVLSLIRGIEDITIVHLKKNLKRIAPKAFGR